MTAHVIPFPIGRRVDAALVAAEAASRALPSPGAPWRPRLNCLAGYVGRVGIVRDLELVWPGWCRFVFTGQQGTWAWAPVAELVPPSTEGLTA